jgi:O-antigen ligase
LRAVRLPFASDRAAAGARLVPTGGVLALAVAAAWAERGSIAAPDWLPYLLVAAGLVAAVALSGGALDVRPLARLSAGALALLAGWALLSALWSPAPALARDEALLRCFYLAALLVPLLTLSTVLDRTRAAALLVAAVAGVAVASAVHTLLQADPTGLYLEGRPYFPITYPNAAAAFFALAFWPAAGLAARPRGSVPLRALALSAAAVTAAAALMCQSKGAIAAFAVSVVVFFALSPQRLRALVPAATALALAGAAFAPLTEPIRAEDGDLASAIDRSAVALLAVAGAGLLAGAVYSLADRRLRPTPGFVRVAGIAVAIAVAAAAVGAVAAFAASVDDPRAYLSERWEELQTTPDREGFTHLSTLGSNRVDFWRVAVDDFEREPAGGVGARGFAASYLERGDSPETPARAHSLPLDVLGEEGVIGAALLLLVLAPLVGIALAGARASIGAAALAAAAVYWLAHAAVDWNWTFPPVGVPFFLVLGIAAAGERRRLDVKAARLVTVGAVVVALAAAAAWTSAELADRAIESPATAERDLRWARRLDPLSTRPLVVEWQRAPTADAKVEALRRALEREPESFALRYFLGLALRDAGRNDEARTELLEAQRRAPRVEAVGTALDSLGS